MIPESSPAPHPWIEEFLRDPKTALADFLAGYARIEPYNRAERPDAARMLFCAPGVPSQALSILDETLTDWLTAQRDNANAFELPAQMQRWLRQVSDGLRLTAVLSLKNTSEMLRRQQPRWMSWLESLTHFDDIDVRANYLTTLALTQRIVPEGKDIKKFGLIPFWMSICEHSAGSMPPYYLDIGLLGLRNAPESDGRGNERLWMTGLGRWAVVRRPSVEIFRQRWLALKSLYPRPPAHWRAPLQSTLRQSGLAALPAKIHEFWTEDVGLDSFQAERPSPRSALKTPPLEPVQELLTELDKPIRQNVAAARRLIAERKRFADLTGESYYLVRSACNLGMRLLEGGVDSERIERGKLAVEFARGALSWKPDDAVIWAVYRDGLAAQGHYEIAELVGWEAIRLFPEDPHRRNQLALLLADLPGRDEEAERLLRETMERFPSGVVAMCQLASLFKRQDRLDEAEALLKEAIRIAPENQAAPVQLLKLRTTPPASHRTLVEPTEEPEIDLQLQQILRGGRLRRMAAHMKWWPPANDEKNRKSKETEALVAEDPNSAYAQFLHYELTGRQEAVGAPTIGGFGVAFMDAIRKRDRNLLERLEKDFPDPSEFYNLARVFLFRDADAAKNSIEWLARPPVGDARPIRALRGFLRERLGSLGQPQDQEEILVEDVSSFIDLIAANDNFKIDLIESALAPWEISLAA